MVQIIWEMLLKSITSFNFTLALHAYILLEMWLTVLELSWHDPFSPDKRMLLQCRSQEQEKKETKKLKMIRKATEKSTHSFRSLRRWLLQQYWEIRGARKECSSCLEMHSLNCSWIPNPISLWETWQERLILYYRIDVTLLRSEQARESSLEKAIFQLPGWVKTNLLMKINAYYWWVKRDIKLFKRVERGRTTFDDD